jgi:hypothetical protein
LDCEDKVTLVMDEEKRRMSLDIFIIRMPAVILGSFMTSNLNFVVISPQYRNAKLNFHIFSHSLSKINSYWAVERTLMVP